MRNGSWGPAPTSVPADLGDGSDLKIAFGLLTEVLNGYERAGQVPTGSQVRLALKHRTYDGFDPKKLGFRQFREFLARAAEAGLVEVDENRPGDVAVRPVSRRPNEPIPSRQIRGDLWRAFLDWAPEELRLFDRRNDAVIRLPREPAPLGGWCLSSRGVPVG